jgi:hypothetical protein
MRTEIALKTDVIELLLKTFGVLETERFITSIKSNDFDYTEWRKYLWNERTIDEIHKMAVDFEQQKMNQCAPLN